MIVVFDQDDKPYALVASRLKSINGTRYATKASIAKVIRGEAKHVVAGSSHPSARKQWRAVARTTRIRIGCRKFSGTSFTAIRDWALG